MNLAPGCPVARLPGSGEGGDVIDEWLRFRTCEPGFLGFAFESGAGPNRAGLHFPRKRAKSEHQQVVPAGTIWYQLVPAGTRWYQLVPLAGVRSSPVSGGNASLPDSAQRPIQMQTPKSQVHRFEIEAIRQ